MALVFVFILRFMEVHGIMVKILVLKYYLVFKTNSNVFCYIFLQIEYFYNIDGVSSNVLFYNINLQIIE